MKVEQMPLDSLIPYVGNARKHDAKNIQEIASSILEYGFNDPIAINEVDSVIIEGHGRLLAAKSIGLKTVPVIKLGHLSPAQIKGYTLAHNRIAEKSEWDKDILANELEKLNEMDFDIDLTGFDSDSLDELDLKLGDEPEYDSEKDDIIPEPKEENEFKVERGDIWILGNHRLMCGDSTDKADVDRLMDGNRAVFCFTSPPYSDQRDYRGELELDPSHLAKFLNAPCDLFAVNLGMKRKDNEVVPYWDEYISLAKGYGHKFLSWNIWDKDLAGGISNQSAMFSITHEWVFVFGEKKVLNRIYKNDTEQNEKRRRYDPVNITGKSQRLVRQKDGSTKLSNRGDMFEHKQQSTVCVVTPVMDRSINHPAMFPVELPEVYLLSCSNENDVIFEPFTGSGTTLIACEKTNRQCYGMEIDPHYCSIIIKRWQDYTGKEAHKC